MYGKPNEELLAKQGTAGEFDSADGKCYSTNEKRHYWRRKMLKGIPKILSPELLKILMEMGHGDEIVIADGNFPSASMAQRLLRADGHGVPELLDAILKLFPLDTFVDQPVALMDVGPGDDYKPEIWDEYEQIISKHAAASEGDAQAAGFEFVAEFVARYSFYERARNAYAVVATSEMALYANIILRKGVIVE